MKKDLAIYNNLFLPNLDKSLNLPLFAIEV